MAIRATASTDLASKPEDVWPLLVATDRLNRLIGMEPVRYLPAPEDKQDAARFLAETKMSGEIVLERAAGRAREGHGSSPRCRAFEARLI